MEATKTLQAMDTFTYDMSQHFDETFKFIDSQRLQGRNVLVHCHAGVSRSATIIVAYLIKKEPTNLTKALASLRSKRPRAKPNEAFMQQLRKF